MSTFTATDHRNLKAMKAIFETQFANCDFSFSGAEGGGVNSDEFGPTLDKLIKATSPLADSTS